jgi:hypothetical protein
MNNKITIPIRNTYKCVKISKSLNNYNNNEREKYSLCLWVYGFDGDITDIREINQIGCVDFLDCNKCPARNVEIIKKSSDGTNHVFTFDESYSWWMDWMSINGSIIGGVSDGK